MQNALKYYYKIDVSFINSYGDGYFFDYYNEKYYLKRVDIDNKDIYNIYELNKHVLSKKVLSHDILYNIYNSFISLIDSKKYVLMRINCNIDKKIDFVDIVFFSSTLSVYYRLNSSWSDRWQKKIDFYEYQMHEIGSKYPLIYDYFIYYVGLAENAISYLNNINNSNSFSISHIRVTSDPIEFYDPFNYIIDYSSRDISEYIKYCFFYDSINIQDVFNYVNINYYDISSLQYIYSRILFPTYFFDFYEKVVDGNMSEKFTLNLISKCKDYKKFLHLFGSYLKNKYNFEIVDWI